MIERCTVGIMRPSKRDLETPAYALSVPALLEAGARVVFLGGRQESLPASDRTLGGTFYEVQQTEGRLRVAKRQGVVAVDAALNTTWDWNNGSLPTLNDFVVRQRAAKDSFYTILAPDLTAATVVARPGEFEPAQLDLLAGDRVVMKPVRGKGGRSVVTASKQDAAARLNEHWQNRAEPMLLQERLALAAWPDHIKASGEQWQAALPAAGPQRELRHFFINHRWYPVARITTNAADGHNNTNDRYLPLDPATIPYKAFDVARATFCRLADEFESAVAIDTVFARRPSTQDDEPTWYTMEPNAIDPVLPNPRDFPELSRQTYGARTALLMRMAGAA